MCDLESELKKLIVETLKLEDVLPEEIGSEELLFGESGLGLDSIDALELGVCLRKIYGIKVDSASDDVRKAFSTIHNLAVFIRENRENPR